MRATSHATSTIGSLLMAHNKGMEGDAHSATLHARSSCLALGVMSDGAGSMSKRVDTPSRLIRASASTIYRAFATAQAMESWLPPQGMTGTMLKFAFRDGGAYRMRLTYNEPRHTPGKTSKDADEVQVRFVKLVPHERIEQAATFEFIP